MKRVSTSNQYFQKNETFFEYLEITIDNKFKISGAHFKNCTFILTDESLILFGCQIINSKLINHVESLGNSKVQFIDNTTLNNVQISGVFGSIIFSSCDIVGFKDSSDTKTISFNNSYVQDFNIEGRCNNLNINNTFFNSNKVKSYWNKVILIEAKCTKTTFEKVKINPFYLASKCFDKSSLDLTSSTLTDHWSRLRKKYAGVSLIIILVLTTLFFLPYLTKSFLLITISNLESQVIEFDKIPLWDALLFGGKSGYEGIIYCILTILLFTFTIGRFWMTISIAKLREEEKFLTDSNFSVVSIHPDKYKKQLIVDRVLDYLLFFSILYSIFKLIDTLSILVPNL